MSIVVLVALYSLPACVCLCVLCLGQSIAGGPAAPMDLHILSKSIHVYAPEVTALYSLRTGVAPVADMYRHPMDGLDMSP